MNHGRTNLFSVEMHRQARNKKFRACAHVMLVAIATGAIGYATLYKVKNNRKTAAATSVTIQKPVAQTVNPAVVAQIAAPAPVKKPDPTAALENAIHEKFSAAKTLLGLETHQEAGGLDISFRTDRIFSGGSADFHTGNDTELSELVAVIGSQAENFNIQIEGHTDSIPVIKNRKQFKTNWELSGARAAAVVRLFERAGVEKNRLEAIAYGESRPKFSQNSKNRRLVIRLVAKGENGS